MFKNDNVAFRFSFYIGLGSVIIILSFVFIYSLSDNNDTNLERQSIVKPTNNISNNTGEKPLVFLIHPYLPKNEILERFKPFIDYLGSVVKRRVEIVISDDYSQHVDLIGNDKYDFAFMGPAAFVFMTEKYGEKPLLAKFEINGKATFQGVIIIRDDSKIKKLTELKGCSFAFGDRKSTMSFQVPCYMLREAGVKLKDLKIYEFLGNHQNIALSVLAGEFDAGAVKEETFNKYKERGLLNLEKTPEISEHLFLASNNLDNEIVELLRKACIDLKDHKDGKRILSSIKNKLTCLVEVKNDDYKNLRKILKSNEDMDQ